MAVEVVRSTVALDHLYAKTEDELVDLEKDANLTEAISNLAQLSDEELIGLFFGANTDIPDDSISLSPSSDDTSSLSPCSSSSFSDSYLTPSPDTADIDMNADIVSTTSSDGVLNNVDDFAIDVDFDWLTEFQENPGQASESLTTTTTTPLPASTAISVNEPTVTSTCTPTTSYKFMSSRRTKLILTAEEKSLLAAEGVELPTDVSLTKAEEKVLKKVRRKIKNKQSAQESRKKKKDYVDGLEMRVKVCTEQNMSLQKKVQSLEKQNSTLMDQLKQLQALVASTHPTKAQAGTCLMVLMLAFGLVIFPLNGINNSPQKDSIASYAPVNVRSRTLLQVSDDYIHDEGLNSPNITPNGSDMLQTFEFELDRDHKETLADLNVNWKQMENEEQTKNVREKTAMRTAKR